MGQSVDRLEVALARQDVKAHLRKVGGKIVRVKSYDRLTDFHPLQVVKDKTRPSSHIDIEDQRKPGANPLYLNPDGMDLAIETAGVKVSPNLKIKVRLRDQDAAGSKQGSALQTGPEEYRLVVHVAKKPFLKPHHLYIINNSLLHELRHVRQMQDEPNHSKLYQQQNMTVGYGKNKYEVDAREFGRLADETGERSWKGLPEGKKILGKAAWGLLPEKVDVAHMKLPYKQYQNFSQLNTAASKDRDLGNAMESAMENAYDSGLADMTPEFKRAVLTQVNGWLANGRAW